MRNLIEAKIQLQMPLTEREQAFFELFMMGASNKANEEQKAVETENNGSK